MSKKQAVMDLLVGAQNSANSWETRLALLNDADTLRKEIKVGWAKLTDVNVDALREEIEQTIARNLADGVTDDTKPTDVDGDKPQDDAVQPQTPTTDASQSQVAPETTTAKVDRGGIGRLVNLLLTTTIDDYATIVAKVKEQYPDAKTTARSVASVAADLRRDGANVPSRRKVAKAPVAA